GLVPNNRIHEEKDSGHIPGAIVRTSKEKENPANPGGVKLSIIECLSSLPLWVLLIAVAVRTATLLLVGFNVVILTTTRIFLLLSLFVLALLPLALRALTLARLSLISFVTHVEFSLAHRR